MEIEETRLNALRHTRVFAYIPTLNTPQLGASLAEEMRSLLDSRTTICHLGPLGCAEDSGRPCRCQDEVRFFFFCASIP